MVIFQSDVNIYQRVDVVFWDLSIMNNRKIEISNMRNGDLMEFHSHTAYLEVMRCGSMLIGIFLAPKGLVTVM